MNKGVEILIARMKSNPEDFDYEGRFSTYGVTLSEMAIGLVRGSKVLYFLPDEDHTALIAAWNEHMRQKFTNNVMKTLVEDPPQLVEQKKESLTQTQAQYRQMLNNPYQNQASWGGAIGIADSTFK
jgi:hypothetical protein